MQEILNQPHERPLPELESFYSEFMADRLTDLANLQDSLSSHDLKTVKDIAHRWKGFCEPYGFGHLGEIATELEIKARDGDEASSGALVKAAATYLAMKKSQG